MCLQHPPPIVRLADTDNRFADKATHDGFCRMTDLWNPAHARIFTARRHFSGGLRRLHAHHRNSLPDIDLDESPYSAIGATQLLLRLINVNTSAPDAPILVGGPVMPGNSKTNCQNLKRKYLQ